MVLAAAAAAQAAAAVEVPRVHGAAARVLVLPAIAPSNF
jgi:hypothetical protein